MNNTNETAAPARPKVHLLAIVGPRTYCGKRIDRTDDAGVILAEDGKAVSHYALIANCPECINTRLDIFGE